MLLLLSVTIHISCQEDKIECAESEQYLFKVSRLESECALHISTIDLSVEQVLQGFIFPSYSTSVNTGVRNETRYACIMKDDASIGLPGNHMSFIEGLASILRLNFTTTTDVKKLYRCVVDDASNRIRYVSSQGQKYDLALFNETAWNTLSKAGSPKISNDSSHSTSVYSFVEKPFQLMKVLKNQATKYVFSQPSQPALYSMDSYIVTNDLLKAVANTNIELVTMGEQIKCLTYRKDVFDEFVPYPLCERYGMPFMPNQSSSTSKEDDKVPLRRMASYPLELSQPDQLSIALAPQKQAIFSHIWQNSLKSTNFLNVTIPQHAQSLLYFSTRGIHETSELFSEGWCVPDIFSCMKEIKSLSREHGNITNEKLLYALLSQRCPCSLNLENLEQAVGEKVFSSIRVPSLQRHIVLSAMIENFPAVMWSEWIFTAISTAKGFILTFLILYLIFYHPYVCISLTLFGLYILYFHLRDIIRTII